MNRREASKKETRRLILKAARKLLVRKGEEHCTMKDIALEAGTSPASVVVHFKNRIALLEEALYGDIEKKLLALKESLPPKDSLLERLIHIPNGFFAFYSRNRNLYRALLRNTIFEPQNKTPHMTRQADQYIQSLTLIIEEEKANGVIRHDVETRVAAASIFSLYLGVLTMLFRTPQLPVEALVQTHSSMVEHFLRGIMNEKD